MTKELNKVAFGRSIGCKKKEEIGMCFLEVTSLMGYTVLYELGKANCSNRYAPKCVKAQTQ